MKTDWKGLVKWSGMASCALLLLSSSPASADKQYGTMYFEANGSTHVLQLSAADVYGERQFQAGTSIPLLGNYDFGLQGGTTASTGMVEAKQLLTYNNIVMDAGIVYEEAQANEFVPHWDMSLSANVVIEAGVSQVRCINVCGNVGTGLYVEDTHYVAGFL